MNMDGDLYEAVVQGETDALLNLREKIDQKTKERWTILHLASKYGKEKCVEVILREFNDKNFLIKVDKDKRTPLHLAAKKGHTSIVVELIKAARDLQPSSQFEKFISKGDNHAHNALNLAAKKNHVDVVKLLIEANPSGVHSKNRNFETPLFNAALHGHKETVELIFELCTTLNLYGPGGKTILHAAALGGKTECLNFIWDKIPDLLLKRDEIGWTAMDYAVSENFESLVNILVTAEKNRFGNCTEYEEFFRERPLKKTGLHKAASRGHISVVLQVMKSSCVFIWCALNKKNQNILHIAANKNRKELVQLIIKECPSLDLLSKEKDIYGNSHLHLLVMRGCFILEVIKREKDHRNAENKNSCTPYDLLYADDDIVVDQLKIKEAFEDSRYINQRWNFGLRKGNPEEDEVLTIKRASKNSKFKKARDLLIKEEIKLYRARINTQIIVTALITTVTFTVGFTIPGGYIQGEEKDNGSAVLSKKVAFNVFLLADTLALLLSMSSLALYFVASMYQDAEEISKLVDASTLFNIVSVVATMLTFLMGIFLVLPHSTGLLIAVFVMSGFFLLLVVFLMFKVMKDPIEKFRE